jgi:hypothetical protein
LGIRPTRKKLPFPEIGFVKKAGLLTGIFVLLGVKPDNRFDELSIT